MRTAGLVGVRRGRKPVTTRPANAPNSRPDLVERKFIAARPHQLWVADITYVRILTGLCYVAFITDALHPSHRGLGALNTTHLHQALAYHTPTQVEAAYTHHQNPAPVAP